MREELIFLLNESAELEHSLACSYLFTAYSLKQRLDEGLSPEELAAVQRWRGELTGVAIEEMYHLAVVTNLLTSVGAPPHFDRPNFPHDCAYYLPDYQIELQPFSETIMDHFLAVEQPDGSNLPAILDPTRLQRVLGDLDNEIGPDPHHFDSQGDVYAAVLACLDDLITRHGADKVFIGAPPNNAVRAFFQSGGWEPIASVETAKRDLAHVVEQGEGSHADSPDSHYARFAAIQREYRALKQANPAFQPARPVITNPFTRTPPEGSGPVTLITDEFAIQVSDLFNEAYGAMLQLLGRFFISFQETDKEAEALVNASIVLMVDVVNPLGSLLCQLPAGAPHDGMTAGPSFVLRTVHSLPDKHAAWQLLRERLQELGDYALLISPHDTTGVLRRAGERMQEAARSLTEEPASPAVATTAPETPALAAEVTLPLAGAEGRITIRANGPYLVEGDLTVIEASPVHTFNGEPVQWHTLREIPVASRPVRLCRCGGSSNKPFCDGTHNRNGFDGTEIADQEPFEVRASVVGDDQTAIADDGSLCIGAGFCRTRTTSVWKLLEESADPEARERMQQMIARCPSGRLVMIDQGEAVEPELPASIAITPGGPIWVRGALPITGSGGNEWQRRNRVTLCRCGGSSNKPFCDGTHVQLHFDER